LVGRGRRWQSAEERDWRQRRGHPWLFLFVCALIVGAVGTGSWLWAIGLLALAAWLVVRS
jgi:hypothetical protein